MLFKRCKSIFMLLALFVISACAALLSVFGGSVIAQSASAWLVPYGKAEQTDEGQVFMGAWALDDRGLYAENPSFTFLVPAEIAIGEYTQIAFQSDKKQIGDSTIGKVFTIMRVQDGLELRWSENRSGSEAMLLAYESVLAIDHAYTLSLQWDDGEGCYKLFLDDDDISSQCTEAFEALKISDIADSYGRTFLAIKQSEGAKLVLGKYGTVYDAYMTQAPRIVQIDDLNREKYAPNQRLWQGCPTIQRVGNRIWAAWFTGGTKEPSILNYPVLAYSDDNGDSWTDPAYVLEFDGYGRVGDVQFWVDPDGNFRMFWVQIGGHVFENRWGVWTCTITDADTGGTPEFSQPQRVCDGLMRNRPVALSNGDWLLCAYDQKDANKTNVYASTDMGTTWSLRGAVDTTGFETYFDEHMLVEMDDGKLWMLIRTDESDAATSSNYIVQSFSSDGGKTWTQAEDSGLRGPSSRFFFTKLDDGNYLLINHKTGTGRGELIARIYDAEIGEWTPEESALSIDTRDNISYPDAVIDESGKVMLIYDRERYGAREIYMTTFNISDVYAPPSENPAIANRKLISRATGERPTDQWPGVVTTEDMLDGTVFMYANSRYLEQIDPDYVKVEIDILDLYRESTWIAVGLSSNRNDGISAGSLTDKNGTRYLNLLFRNRNGELYVQGFRKGVAVDLIPKDGKFIDALGKTTIEFVQDNVSGSYRVYINGVGFENDAAAFADVHADMICDVNGVTYLSFAALSPTSGAVNYDPFTVYRGWIVESVTSGYPPETESVRAELSALKDKTITLGDETAIVALRARFDALEENFREMITESIYLENAEKQIAALKKAISDVEALIDKLPTVEELRITDKVAYDKVVETYEALNDEQKLYIDPNKAAKLQACIRKMQEVFEPVYAVEKRIETLPTSIGVGDKQNVVQLRAQVDEIKTAYEALSTEYRSEVRNAEKLNEADAAVRRIEEMIALDAALASLLVDASVTEEAVVALRARYDALTTEERGQIVHLYKLTAAERLVAARTEAARLHAQAQSVVEQIEAACSGILDAAAIAEADHAYEELSDTGKQLVYNRSLLQAAKILMGIVES